MKTVRLFPRPDKPIGFLDDGRPIYPVAGGSGEDEIEVESDDEDGEEEEDGGTVEDGTRKWTPPSRAEWLRTQAALVKANASAKTRREALAEKEKAIAELQKEKADREADAERKALMGDQLPAGGGGRKSKKAAATTPSTVLPDSVLTKAQVRQLTAQAAKEAEERTAAKYQGKVVNQAARAALKEAGAAGNVSRLVNLLNLEEVQVDDDGEVDDSLEAQIEQLKTELPQLFAPVDGGKPVRKRAPAPKVTPAGRAEEQQRPMSTAERMAQQVLGSRV